MKAMILAAGKGERMRPLTEHTPKPLLQVRGKALIEYTVERLQAAGFTDLVVNVSYLGEQIESFLGDGSAHGVRIQYSRETEPLETGGGIAKALPLLTKDGEHPFVLINSDVWSDIELKHLKNAMKEEINAHLVLVKNPEHHLKGDFVLDRGAAFPREEGKLSFTYSGIAVIHPRLFRLYAPHMEKFPLLPLLLQAMSQRQVSAELHEGLWVDVGTPERLASLSSPHETTLNGAISGH